MGMDAKTSIWVGFRAADLEDRLAEEIVDELESAGEIEIAGLKVSVFWVSEEQVGLGVQLLHHDWDYGVEEVDLTALTQKAQELKLSVAAAFKTWGIDDEPKVLIASDFS